MTPQEFDEAVADALDEVPAELLDLMNNVVFLVEDESPDGDPKLLGIYEGTPLTERHEGWAAGSLTPSEMRAEISRAGAESNGRRIWKNTSCSPMSPRPTGRQRLFEVSVDSIG